MVMEKDLPEPAVLLAELGYATYKVRKTMVARKVVPVILMRKTRRLWIAPLAAGATSSPVGFLAILRPFCRLIYRWPRKLRRRGLARCGVLSREQNLST